MLGRKTNMVAEFSEIQYMFGAMREIEDIMTNSGYHSMIPIFPTQPQEKNAGYDAAFIDKPIIAMFLQFKRSEHISNRKAASEYSFYQSAYYRFKLYHQSISDQHNILVKLAKAERINEVYYVAPCFYKYADYNDYYRGKSIVDHSVFVDCGVLKEINDNQTHTISYRENGTDLLMKSDPIKIKDGCVNIRETVFRHNENIRTFLQRLNEVLELKLESIYIAQEYLAYRGIVLQLWW